MTLKKQWNWNLGCSLLLVGVLAAAFLFYLWAQILVNIPYNLDSRSA
ncbi:hypothetical protein [Streptococcus sanguinis]